MTPKDSNSMDPLKTAEGTVGAPTFYFYCSDDFFGTWNLELSDREKEKRKKICIFKAFWNTFGTQTAHKCKK
jgi:hypothetical protein